MGVSVGLPDKFSLFKGEWKVPVHLTFLKGVNEIFKSLSDADGPKLPSRKDPLAAQLLPRAFPLLRAPGGARGPCWVAALQWLLLARYC